MRSSSFGVMLAYGQLVLGAHLRHPADDGSPRIFQLVLLFHAVAAIALSGHVLSILWNTWRPAQDKWTFRPALASAALVLLQLVLGVATLIVKYGWPNWLGGELISPAFTVTAKGFWTSIIVTAHVANGSAILAILAVLAVRSARFVSWRQALGATESVAQNSTEARDAGLPLRLIGVST